jgi:hypothetical protein
MILCLTTPAPDLEVSATFLSRLGFEPVSPKSNLMTDGAAVVDVDTSPRARAGVRLWRGALGREADAILERHGAVAFEGGQLMAAPSGVPVWVMDGPGPELELGRIGALLGTFAGISMETPSLSRSAAFWSGLLDARVAAGGADQGWLTLRRDGMEDLSIMGPLACPHSFANPSLTYFNGERNTDVIRAVRALGIPVFEEVGGTESTPAENVILREPGGLGFFVFND